MRIGDIVRLSRPWDHGEEYKDAIGIVENIGEYPLNECRVRLLDPTDKYTHYTFTCFKHRFDILKE